MSERDTAVPVEDAPHSEPPNVSLSQLTELARQAYEQKRTKNCLDLTRAILLIDPENAEAQLMRSSIRMEMHLDLNNARALLRDVHLKDRPQRYSDAGNTLLRRILSVDPDSEEAKALLSEGDIPHPVAPAPPVVEQQLTMPENSFHLYMGTERRQWIPRAGVVICVVLAVTGFLGFRSTRKSAQAVPLAGSLKTPKPHANNIVWTANGRLGDSMQHESAGALMAAVVMAETRAPGIVSAPSRPDSEPAVAPVALAPNGKLAISSPTSVEIYQNDEHIGSTPVTMELPPGTHTFEYRHENLRKIVTHTISSNETTRAAITFEVPVQINAKPWADVLVDGIERKILGQTPLSGVRVPIGGVLVFSNPEFGTKKYRVTGTETAIQISFP